MTEIIFSLANCYLMTGMIDSAISCYIKVIKMDDSRSEFFYNLGNALSLTDRYKEAVRSYKKAILLKKDYYDGYFNLANAYFMMGKYQDSLNNYEICLNFNENNDDVKFALAKLYIEYSHANEDNLQKARSILEVLIKKNDRHINTIFYYGKLHEKEKKNNLAKAEYRVCIILIEENTRT